MVSTHLKNISQIGSFPQVGVKIKDIWNHHLASQMTWDYRLLNVFFWPQKVWLAEFPQMENDSEVEITQWGPKIKNPAEKENNIHTSWWLSPCLKNMLVKLNHFPKDIGWK